MAAIHAPDDLFGISSFAEAVRQLLEKGNYQQAMLAARYTTALEDHIEGELLTDEILAHDDVKNLVADLRAFPPGEAFNAKSLGMN